MCPEREHKHPPRARRRNTLYLSTQRAAPSDAGRRQGKEWVLLGKAGGHSSKARPWRYLRQRRVPVKRTEFQQERHWECCYSSLASEPVAIGIGHGSCLCKGARMMLLRAGRNQQGPKIQSCPSLMLQSRDPHSKAKRDKHTGQLPRASHHKGKSNF